MIDTLKGKTKSYSKTFPSGAAVDELRYYFEKNIEKAPNFKNGLLRTAHKYVITVTKIIQEHTDDALSK